MNTDKDKPIQSSVSIFQKPSGPIVVSAEQIDVQKNDGAKQQFFGKLSLCGCGRSNNLPLCDGSHKNIAS
ncbi:hypothetical protein FLL45_05610 [Aliikangiella marina]|uniref:Iron-binding zinc finger CDGSH type domain-containing protein n=1 Tax=Aliikangiella marina TaxID=1712262 RepID=A0A545TJL4_9GAMM|nr:CDGSH iron-sulfur domain-containing protein [Aliikangiella marina]TQV77420.1 hypothetical protein FLL45_05610 [Aliikangiella marina]